MTIILFCSEPFAPRRVEPDFAVEHEAAQRAGFSVALLDHTRVTEGDARKAVAAIQASDTSAIYRGWMLRVTEYETMYSALIAKGVRLINDPKAYRFCHYLPDGYGALEGHTPRTAWLPVHGDVDFDQVTRALQPFGSGPVIVKDYVKSQKHYWSEACFIPRADDCVAVERVVRRFLELQGDDLNEGLVFREYVPLRIVGTHPRSGLPLAAEVRTFWFDGELVLAHAYWGDLAAAPEPPLDWMRSVAARVTSRFFAMDVALRADGEWTVIELGDGQVSGLPSVAVADQFYLQLQRMLADRGPGATA